MPEILCPEQNSICDNEDLLLLTGPAALRVLSTIYILAHLIFPTVPQGCEPGTVFTPSLEVSEEHRFESNLPKFTPLMREPIGGQCIMESCPPTSPKRERIGGRGWLRKASSVLCSPEQAARLSGVGREISPHLLLQVCSCQHHGDRLFCPFGAVDQIPLLSSQQLCPFFLPKAFLLMKAGPRQQSCPGHFQVYLLSPVPQRGNWVAKGGVGVGEPGPSDLLPDSDTPKAFRCLPCARCW